MRILYTQVNNASIKTMEKNFKQQTEKMDEQLLIQKNKNVTDIVKASNKSRPIKRRIRRRKKTLTMKRLLALIWLLYRRSEGRTRIS